MINIVNIISTALDDAKRRIPKFLRFGKSDVQTAFEASPAGVDSNPIKNTRAIYLKTTGKEEKVIVGYISKNKKASIGEVRLFSTDDKGEEKTFLWLKNDGTIQVGGDSDNSVRFSELKAGFDELRGELNEFITLYNKHTHISSSVGNSNAPTLLSSSKAIASIDKAKIDEIKVP